MGHGPICQYLWLFILVMPCSDNRTAKTYRELPAIQKAILSNTKYLAALIGIVLYVYILNKDNWQLWYELIHLYIMNCHQIDLVFIISGLTFSNIYTPSAQSGGPFAMKHCYAAIFEK